MDLLWWLGALVLLYALVRVYLIASHMLYFRSLRAKVHAAKISPEAKFRGKHIFFLVNPYSGDMTNAQLYYEVVVPLMARANVTCTAKFTQYKDHASEIFQTEPLDSYAAICVIGGDTTFNECLDGLWQRSGRNRQQFEAMMAKLSFALLPGGTSNTMAISLGHGDMMFSLVRLIEGNVRPCDMMEIKTEDGVYWNPMSAAWGLVGRHDTLQEEKMRWMSRSVKDLLLPILAIMYGETFYGKVRYLDAETNKWIEFGRDDFCSLNITSIPMLGKDISLSTTLQPDDGQVQLDIIFGDVPLLTVIAVFLAFSKDAGHLEKYKDKKGIYHVHRAKEVIIDARNGNWTSAGRVMCNKLIHFHLRHKAINFIC